MKTKYMSPIREGNLIHSTLANGNSSYHSLILITLLIPISHMTTCNQVKYKLVKESKFQGKRGFNLWTIHHQESHPLMFPHLNGAFSMISKIKNPLQYLIRAINCQEYIQIYICAKEMDSRDCKDTVAKSNWNSRIFRPISSTKR